MSRKARVTRRNSFSLGQRWRPLLTGPPPVGRDSSQNSTTSNSSRSAPVATGERSPPWCSPAAPTSHHTILEGPPAPQVRAGLPLFPQLGLTPLVITTGAFVVNVGHTMTERSSPHAVPCNSVPLRYRHGPRSHDGILAGWLPAQARARHLPLRCR